MKKSLMKGVAAQFNFKILNNNEPESLSKYKSLRLSFFHIESLQHAFFSLDLLLVNTYDKSFEKPFSLSAQTLFKIFVEFFFAFHTLRVQTKKHYDEDN